MLHPRSAQRAGNYLFVLAAPGATLRRHPHRGQVIIL
jgi:hypothetical protein